MGLRVEGLRIELGGRAVLDALTAAFEPGMVTAVIGPNGAGKSSLLRTLVGLVPAAAGSCALDGVAIGVLDPVERARRIGYLPQTAEVAWNIAARAIVELGRAPYRSRFAAMSDDDRAAVEAAMLATDTARFAGRPIKELSGGERARVLLARVLAGTPGWLLVDEPLASLDPAHQVDILDRLRATATAGVGMVMVVHDLNHAARIADRVLVLHEGRMLAGGTIADVFHQDILREAFGIGFEIVAGAGGPLILPAR